MNTMKNKELREMRILDDQNLENDPFRKVKNLIRSLMGLPPLP